MNSFQSVCISPHLTSLCRDQQTGKIHAVKSQQTTLSSDYQDMWGELITEIDHRNRSYLITVNIIKLRQTYLK